MAIGMDEIGSVIGDQIERLKRAFHAVTGREYEDEPRHRPAAKKTAAKKRGRPAMKKSSAKKATAKKGTGKRGRPKGSKNAKKRGTKTGHGRMDFPLPGVGSAKGTEGA